MNKKQGIKISKMQIGWWKNPGSIQFTILSGFILMVLLLGSGCKKNLTELNVNPNDPLTTNPGYLLRYALQQGMGNYNSDVTVQQWSVENWVMFMASRGGPEPGKEYIMPSGKDALWTEQYSQALSNTQAIINLIGDDPERVNLLAVAQIWKVYLFQRITDLWGDMPYSEALEGITELNFTPVYDPQQQIYMDMLSSLKSAVALFDLQKPFYQPDADLIYQGDINHWIAFANSLRLRLATHINVVDPETYRSELQDLASKPLISSNGESAIFPYNSVVKTPLYETMYRGESVVQNNPSKFLCDLLVQSNDPRTRLILEKAPLSFLPVFPPYNGVPNLVPDNDPVWNNYNKDGDWGDISRIGSWYLRDATPGVIMSYAEVCFLKAEGALRGAFPGDADALMKEGIRADIEFYRDFGTDGYAIGSDTVETYLAALPPTDLEAIITQKWISFVFENGYEAWGDYRRTGYPVLLHYDGSPVDRSSVPARLTYPYREYTLNQANYNAAIANQGPDNEWTRVWWNFIR